MPDRLRNRLAQHTVTAHIKQHESSLQPCGTPKYEIPISARPTPTATQHLPTSVTHQQTSNFFSTTHFDTNVTRVKSPTRTATRNVVHTSGENGFSCELQVVKRTSLLENRRKQVNGGKLTQLASGLHTKVTTPKRYAQNRHTSQTKKPHPTTNRTKVIATNKQTSTKQKTLEHKLLCHPSNFFDITLALRGGM